MSKFTYEVNYDKTATITSYTGNDKELIIPYEIDGHNVFIIGKEVFANCTNLEKVVVPDVALIDKGAFFGCKNLKSITLTEYIMEIRSYAFAGCTSLETFVMPGVLTEIGAGAFAGCTSLKRAEIPAGTKIAEDSFPQNTVIKYRKDESELEME